MNELIGNNIMILRKENGLTQEQLANALGISYQAVSKWETGNACPDISTLPLLADLFSVSVDQLIGRVPLMGQPESTECCGAPSEAARAEQSLPWPDDDNFYAVLYHGHHLVDSLAGDPGLVAAAEHFVFEYEGPARNVSSDFSVEIKGDVAGFVEAGINVKCGDVGGAVRAGGDVNCRDVEDSVNAGGSVNCADVGESVSAGASVRCSDVGGNVNAGLKVQCGDVVGSVHSAFRTGMDENYSEDFDRLGKNMASFGEELGKRISSAVNKAMNATAWKNDRTKDE